MLKIVRSPFTLDLPSTECILTVETSDGARREVLCCLSEGYARTVATLLKPLTPSQDEMREALRHYYHERLENADAETIADILRTEEGLPYRMPPFQGNAVGDRLEQFIKERRGAL